MRIGECDKGGGRWGVLAMGERTLDGGLTTVGHNQISFYKSI